MSSYPAIVFFDRNARPPFRMTALDVILFPINSIIKTPLYIDDNFSNLNSCLFISKGLSDNFKLAYRSIGLIPSRFNELSNGP